MIMKLLILLSATVVLATASNHNNHHRSDWNRQNIRSNDHLNPSSSSSSESAEQSQNTPKTCSFILKPALDEIIQFHQWVQKFNKHYSTEQEKRCRMFNLISKLRDIIAHNRRFMKGKETFKRALNHLSDMTRQEVKDLILLKNMEDNNIPKTNINMLKDMPQPRLSVDYRDENLVTPVGHQGRCGCCWAFSAAAVIEGQLKKCGISEETVSPQNMLDCVSPNNNGCIGGNPFDALVYTRAGGILPAAKYPYYGKQNQCKFNRSDVIAYVDQPIRYAFLEIPQVEPYMRKVVSSVGPISTVMYVNEDFQDYSSGVFKSTNCNNQPPNHAVTIVGYGTDPKFGDYWLLKNSWGTSWGEKGFARMARGKNMCVFESRIYYAQIMDKDKNVCRLP